MIKRALVFDPSYKSTGVFVRLRPGDPLCGLTKVCEVGNAVYGFHSLGIQMYAKGFPFDVQYTVEIMHIFREFIERFPFEFDIIISEMPPPNGTYAAGLYSLDTALFIYLMELPGEFYGLYPNAVNQIVMLNVTDEERAEMRARKNPAAGPPKRIIKAVALRLLPEASGCRINHDEATAYLLYRIVGERFQDHKPIPKIFRIRSGQSDLMWG